MATLCVLEYHDAIYSVCQWYSALSQNVPILNQGPFGDGVKRECERLSRHRGTQRAGCVCHLTVFCLCSHLDQFGSLRCSVVKKSSKGAKSGFSGSCARARYFFCFCLLNQVEPLAWP